MNSSSSSSPQKRKGDPSITELFHPPKKPVGREPHSSMVADHYNKRGNTTCAERRNSKIFYMRNFNNWIKSVLIKKYLDKLREHDDHYRPIVLDLGVGKGGDLLKWDKGHISKLICTDIAETSINQCKERYNTLKKRSKNRRLFDAEFIVADSSKESLAKKFHNPNLGVDMTSCQFVIHYTFESEDQADRMVQNACSSLREGGFFIGTTLNDAKVLGKLKDSRSRKFGNDVYSVEFLSDPPYSEFGCKYIFKLHGVVDCPEFLLRKNTMIKLCKKHGMRLVEWKPFSKFFEENSKAKENFRLIRKMQALEVFPSYNDPLNSALDGDYAHAEAECNRINQKYPGSNPRVATLSKTEWEAASLYVVYVFMKEGGSSIDESAHETESISEEKIPLVIL